MLPRHPMQLTPAYHARLDRGFLTWYLREFTSADRRIYGHWSVSGYCSPDRAYHREVLLVNGIVQVVNPSGVDLDTDLSGHTDGRNTGAIALCVGSLDSIATTASLGDKPPTPAELQAFIAETAQVCINQHIPIANLMTHAEAANNVDFPRIDSPGIPAPPSYGPGSDDFERWDWHVHIHSDALTLGPLFDGPIAFFPPGRVPIGLPHGEERHMPAGTEYFPDWWRGQTILRIQELTRSKWAT